jgi:hypothetical protein
MQVYVKYPTLKQWGDIATYWLRWWLAAPVRVFKRNNDAQALTADKCMIEFVGQKLISVPVHKAAYDL